MEDRLTGSPFWQKYHTEGQLTETRATRPARFYRAC